MSKIDPAKLKPHPLSELLPLMSADEFESLLCDIQDNGLREEIVLLDGKVLDGRNRLRACLKANKPPRFRCFDPSSEGRPLAYIISKATHRHMNDTQKACSAVNIEAELATEGNGRKGQNGFHKREPVPATDGAPIHTDKTGKNGKNPSVEIGEIGGKDSARAREVAGRLFGVSGRYVQDAKLLREKAPKLFQKCFEGAEVLSRAKREYQRSVKTKALKKKAAAHAGAVSAGQGDLWKLLTGDCMEEMARLEARPRLIFADPPYNLGFDYGAGSKADALTESNYLQWCDQWIERCAQLLANDGSLFLMIDAGHQADLFFALKGATTTMPALHYRNTIIWHETFGLYSDANFTPCWRAIHYFTKHTTRFVWHGDSIRIPSDRQAKYGDKRADPAGKVPGNVWSEFPRLVDNAAERMPGFPTQLPVALLERIVLACSDPGDIVFDPFTGTGTTGAAALRHGRRFLGIEKQDKNAAWARARMAAEVASCQLPVASKEGK